MLGSSRYRFAGRLMEFCTIERLDKSRDQVARVDLIRKFPFQRHYMTGALWLRRIALPMAARDANRSYLSDISLFRDRVLAGSKPAGDDRSLAHVATVSGKVEILFSHCLAPGNHEIRDCSDPTFMLVFTAGNICSLLLGSSTLARRKPVEKL
jgi:hypothetical protein